MTVGTMIFTAAVIAGGLMALGGAMLIYRGARKTGQFGVRLRGMEYRLRRLEQEHLSWESKLGKTEQALQTLEQSGRRVQEQEMAADRSFYAGLSSILQYPSPPGKDGGREV